MKHMQRFSLSSLAMIAAVACQVAKADIVIMGNDTSAPVAEYSETGTFLGSLGVTGSTGVAFDGLGHAYVAYGNTGVIREYDGSGTLLNTINFSGIGGGTGYMEDITFLSNTLWISGNDGVLYHINLSGTLLGSLGGGQFGQGIATDGSFLYTTDGFGGTGVITQRTLAGVATGVTINTGIQSTLSLGYDAGNNAFWLGALGHVYEVNLSGATIGGFNTSSANFFHDGVAVGSFTTSSVPEPSAISLMALGLFAVVFFVRRPKTAR